MAARSIRAAEEVPGSRWAGRIAWFAILACAALVPLVTSIRLGGAGAWSFTAEPYHLPKLLALAVLIGIATLAWAVDVLAFGRHMRIGREMIGLGVFGALILISTAFAIEPLSSLFGSSALSTGTTTWMLCLWLAALVAQFVRSPRDLKELSWAVVGGATAVSAIALLQSVGLDPLSTPYVTSTEWMVLRGIATIGNPDFTGLFLVAPAAISFGLSKAAARSGERTAAVACAVLISGVAFLTMTRAAWLGVVIGIVVFLALTVRDRVQLRKQAGRYALVALLLVAVGTVIATPDIVIYRFARIAKGLDYFTSGRLTLWGDALRIVGQHPLFGTGADRLALGGYEVQRTLAYTDAGQRLVLQDPHSLPLLTAGLFGIPAALALLAAVVVVILGGLKRAKSSSTPAALLYAGWVAGLAGLFAAALLSVWTITIMLMAFITVGVVMAPSLKQRSPGLLIRSVIVAAAFLLVGVSVWGAARTFSASREIVLTGTGDSQAHFNEAMRKAPWDAKIRTDYLWAKIVGNRPVLAGPDASAAKDAAASLDAEMRLAIREFPEELLLHRLRIDLYRMAAGAPGYQPEKESEAIDDALAAFPDDPEFSRWRAETPAQ